jgi:hypothetical protein
MIRLLQIQESVLIISLPIRLLVKSSMTFTNEAGEQEKDELTYNRQDFWVTTSNKQLNLYSISKPCSKKQESSGSIARQCFI